MAYQSIEVGREGGVVTISLNEPQTMNSMSAQMLQELAAIMAECEADRDVRSLILTAHGRGFCAGANLGLLSGGDGEGASKWLYDIATQLHDTVVVPMRRMAKPIIAGINGVAAGAGIGLMLACDIRVAAAEAVFTLAYSGIGASPDGSTSFYLPKLVGVAKAMELYLFNDRLTAEQAQQLGLINRVVPGEILGSTVREMATKLANGPTFAYGQAKHLFNTAFTNDLATQLDDEARAIGLCAGTADFREGIAAFRAKRSASFQGR